MHHWTTSFFGEYDAARGPSGATETSKVCLLLVHLHLYQCVLVGRRAGSLSGLQEGLEEEGQEHVVFPDILSEAATVPMTSNMHHEKESSMSVVPHKALEGQTHEIVILLAHIQHFLQCSRGVGQP